MNRRELTEGWTVRAAGGPVPTEVEDLDIPATVPGVVHTDLLAAGLIPDPLVSDHEAELFWIGRARWVYTTTFDWSPDGSEHSALVCDGLDTVAAVHVNGVLLGSVSNQLRVYRFDLNDVLQPGTNTIRIEFESALDVAEAEARRLGPRPKIYPHPFAMIRKSACNFGWDWGPSVVTAGIWRAIAIESWSGTRIAAVRVSAGSDRTATISVDLDGPGDFTATIAGHTATGRGEVDISVPEAELWWPRSHGNQPLYGLVVETETDRTELRVGFRDVAIDSSDGAFAISVNGEPIYVRGANWIPDDPFPSRMTPARYAARIADAVDANMNLLRVWGGGIYESDSFYQQCDELGVMVWQDFLFACAAYPEEQPLWDEVAAETTDAINRIASHPSLVVWNGANENIWEHADLDWSSELDGKTWGEGYYLRLLPELVEQLDSGRPYVPNSPFSWDTSHAPNDPADALVHIWDVWNEKDYTHYASYQPRFVSEFGFQGPPAWSTLTRAIDDDPLRADGPVLMVHQKADDGQRKLADGLRPHFPEPRDFQDWHWATQLNQARAIRFAIRHFRSLAPYNQGAIVWQLNDCWPAVSWAAVDSSGIRKPLWFALRSAFADRIAIIDGDEVVVVNDASQPLATQLNIGDELVTVAVPARSSLRMPAPGGELLVHGPDIQSDLRLIAEPVDEPLSWPAYSATAHPTDQGYDVTIIADHLTVDLCLFPDRLDPAATVHDGMITLRQGERFTFHVRSDAELDAAALTTIPVLRSANDLFR